MKHVIEVEGLVKEFNSVRVLDGITFYVDEGEVFGLLGPNGAGKTTTIKILLGLLKPTSGKALVFGKSLANDGSKDLRRRVGVLLEGDGLFPKLTAYENLDFYARIYGLSNRRERELRIKELLELVDLYEVRDLKVAYLSRGMRRRLALARALINNPKVLFLDEPTVGLDPESRVMVRDLVIKLSKKWGVTILYTSHDLREVEEVCLKVGILVRGRLIAYGYVSELISRFSKSVIEVRLSRECELLKAYNALKLRGYIVEISSSNRSILVIDGDAPEVLRELVSDGVNVEEVRRLGSSLEDVYFKIVKGD